jgi:hypothetical protein
MSFTRGTCSALWVCLAVVACSRGACADEPPRVQYGFDYQAGVELGCATASELRAAISRQLEYDAFVPEAAVPEYSVRVAIAKAGAGLEARIDWMDREGRSDGERRLVSETADCTELARGVVFAVAVQIQLRASSAAVAAKPAASPPPPPPPSRRPPVLVPPSRRGGSPSAGRTSTGPLLLVGLGAEVSRGWSPGTAFGLGLVGAVSVGRAWLGASVGATAPTTHELPDGTGFDARSLNGTLSPCFRTPPVGWCVTGMIGRLHIRGYGVDHPLNPASTLMAIGGRLELLLPALRSFGVLVHAQVLGTLTPRDVVLNRVTAWSTAPVYVGAGVDLAMIFR